MPTLVIAGCSSGVGAETARRLTNKYNLFGLVPNDAEVDRMERDGLVGLGVMPLVCDIADPGQVAATAANILRLQPGGVNALVNCAAVWTQGGIEEVDPAEMARAIGVNFTGAANLAHVFAPLISKTGGGHIVNIASQAAVHASPTRSVYAATKAAVLSLFDSLAIELAPGGVAVTSILPGPIATPFYERANQERDTTGWLTAEDVAGVISYVLSLRPEVVVPRIDITPISRVGG